MIDASPLSLDYHNGSAVNIYIQLHTKSPIFRGLKVPGQFLDQFHGQL